MLLPGCRSMEMTVLLQALYDARELAMERLKKEAEELQAEGIVGVQLQERLHKNGFTHAMEGMLATDGELRCPRFRHAPANNRTWAHGLLIATLPILAKSTCGLGLRAIRFLSRGPVYQGFWPGTARNRAAIGFWSGSQALPGANRCARVPSVSKHAYWFSRMTRRLRREPRLKLSRTTSWGRAIGARLSRNCLQQWRMSARHRRALPRRGLTRHREVRTSLLGGSRRANLVSARCGAVEGCIQVSRST